nr:NrfD/PsrC family molybdoenzyme membrane anchor subunit [uncultured Rhodopila sp.]
MNRSLAAPHQRNWDLRAAGNFVFGGTGAGLIVTAALAAAAAAAPFRLPLAIGLFSVMIGLSLVWLEIGKPWRALNVFFHPHTSWMTRESIVAGALIPIGLIAVVLASATAALAAAALACGFLFCQAHILRAARGIPAWRQKEIVPFILATGLAEGSGLYLLAGAQTLPWLALALFAGLLREGAWLAYRAGLARTPGSARSLGIFDTQAGRLARGAQLVALVSIAMTPLLAGFPGIALLLACTGGALAALAGWGLKALLITRAAFTRPVAVPVIPVRGSGGGPLPR